MNTLVAYAALLLLAILGTTIEFASSHPLLWVAAVLVGFGAVAVVWRPLWKS